MQEKLIFDPTTPDDYSVLKGIAYGMRLRYMMRECTDAEIAFLDRLNKVLSSEEAEERFDVSVDEARSASDAIRTNTDYEKDLHLGRLTDPASKLAEQALARIASFSQLDHAQTGTSSVN